VITNIGFDIKLRYCY